MSLADGPHAHDESKVAIHDIVLVGVRHQGGIEVGGRLECILLGQIAPQELASFDGVVLQVGNQVSDRGEVMLELVEQVPVAMLESAQGVRQRRGDLLVREPIESLDELLGAGGASDQFLVAGDEDPA